MAAIIETTLDVIPEQEAERIIDRFFDTACALIESHYAVIALRGYSQPDFQHVLAKGLDVGLYRARNAGAVIEGALKSAPNDYVHVRSGLTDIAGFPPGHPPVRSFLAVAIASRGREHGWMYFAEPYGRERFTDEDERIAATLALHIALFYDNAMIQDLMQKRSAEVQLELVNGARKPAGPPATDVQHAKMADVGGHDVGAIAHDFNNVITIFKSVAEDLSQDHTGNPDIADQADILKQAVQRGSDLVSRLRGLASKF